MSENMVLVREKAVNKFIEDFYTEQFGNEVTNKERIISSKDEEIIKCKGELENRVRELEVDVTVKERIKLEKGEVRIITEKIKELEKKEQEFFSQKRQGYLRSKKEKVQIKVLNEINGNQKKSIRERKRWRYYNENKKRVAQIQGAREDSDSEIDG
ncbi:13794_t:CDS:2 [Rhizophagus irregularis]|nr:13794_t:CDS:2 [Rhizophagus irregularis]